VKHFLHAWSIVKRASHPQLGLIVDSFHTLALGDDPGGIKEIPGDKIFFMQLADAPLLAMDVLQWRRRYSCFPGQGQFDLVNFVEQVLKAGYAGNISLEVFNELFREASNRRTAIDAMRSLLFLEGEVRKRLERATSSSAAVDSRARPVERIELFDPPAAPSLAGICSLEFAVDDESGRAVGTLLENLGFRPAGRHRSKEVTLYRQGSIDLILNAEPNSHARTHFLERGASVCGIGLRTDDPFRALKRATALHCERVDIGSNELSSIRAPDGSLIYFVPSDLGLNRPYEIDVALTDGNSGRGVGVGLEFIDHIALGLPSDELDSWVLFCRAGARYAARGQPRVIRSLWGDSHSRIGERESQSPSRTERILESKDVNSPRG
jgi:4-hydroxyphenylpyruvate dioxygenase